MCHNETVNIWSHCLGLFFFLLVFAGLLIWIVPEQLKYANEVLDKGGDHITLLNSEVEKLETLYD